MKKNHLLSCCFIAVLAISIFTGCQTFEASEDGAKIRELEVSPLLLSGDYPLIRGCLWFDENTLILGKHFYNLGTSEIYSYNIDSAEATLLPCNFPADGLWDWGQKENIRTSTVVGFACNSLITFNLGNMQDINILPRKDNIEYSYSPDLKFVAEVHEIQDSSDSNINNKPLSGAKLLLRNLETGEVGELHSFKNFSGEGFAAQRYWSNDSKTLTYLADSEHFLIYDLNLSTSKLGTVGDLNQNADTKLSELVAAMYTPAGKLFLVAAEGDNTVIAEFKDSYQDMDWQPFELLHPPYQYISKANNKIFAEDIGEETGIAIVSYQEDLSQFERVFFQEDEYLSSAGLSPDGSKLAVFTYTNPNTDPQGIHLYIVNLN